MPASHPYIRIAALLITAVPPFALAQQAGTNEPTTDKATIQALMVEVRQLRLALERSTSLLPRMQLAANRVQSQQERIDRLSRELRDFRFQMAERAADKERTASGIKQIETEIGEAEPAKRKELEGVVKHLTLELEQKTAQDQQDRAQEIELMSQLQSEQAKLSALDDQLNRLEKMLQDTPPSSPPNQH